MGQKNSSALAATSYPSHDVLDRLETNNITPIRDVKLDDIVVESLDTSLIPEGQYKVAYQYHETKVVFNTPKVFVNFIVVDLGPYHGLKLFRAFRVNELIGKPSRNGRFKLKKRSDLLLMLCHLYENQRIRPDRISLRDLKGLVLNVMVRTVTKDYRQKTLPEILKYSVIGDVRGIEAGHMNI
jgi:hypothetical protein